MTHTLIGADRGTHLKIVAVALAGAVTLVGITARVAASDDAIARQHGNTLLIKAGKLTISAALDPTTTR
jgi:hypothetical protein